MGEPIDSAFSATQAAAPHARIGFAGMFSPPRATRGVERFCVRFRSRADYA